MRDFVIYTDSSSDISEKILREWGVESLSLTFRFSDSEREYSNGDMEIGEFYAKMKKGGIAKTAAVNSETFREAFEAILKTGRDVLYVGFSSGLSTTYNSARIAAESLNEQYPDSKVITVDTLAASAGFGMLVRFAVLKKAEGKTIDEVASYIESIRLKMCHWFTVDDLVYLKRGGRVSPTVAFVGNLLGIKPVLHVDNEGHLVNVTKVRGRRAAIGALFEKYGELAENPTDGLVYISHGDCLSDAESLAAMIEEKYGVKTEIITDVGPVIGAHSGPGTLALFFVGKER